jgi:L-malate glycosyltransferase
LSKPAHILFLIDSYFGGTGGAEAVLARIVRLLPRDRYRCSVITFLAESNGQHAHELDCPFHVFPLERTYDGKAFRAALALRRYIRDEHVVLAHTFFETADLWAAPVAKLSGVRRIISSRRDMGILRQPKHRLFYRWLASIYDQVQVVSNEVGAYAIREDGLDPKRVHTIYNGIEPELFVEGAAPLVPRESLGVGSPGEATQLILSVGNLRRVKGFDTLLEAAALVCRQFPSAYFVVAGNPHEPDFHQELLTRRAALDLDRNVIFLGKRTDIASLLATADVFLLPSRSEGLSNALLEAMASRLPVVATRVGGNPEVVSEGESGYLVEAEDAPAMAARLMDLLAHPERSKAMGRKGRAIVEARFTVDTMVARMVAAYDALLSNSQ